MERKQLEVNEYFKNLITEIADTFPVYAEMFFASNGGDYEGYTVGEGYRDNPTTQYEREVENYFNITIAHGASKLVIISEDENDIAKNYVCKIPFEGIDYCALEEKYYNNISKEYKFYLKFFAETWKGGAVEFSDKFGKMGKKEFYIMRRAEVNEHKVEKISYDRWIKLGGDEMEYCPEKPEEEVFECFKEFFNTIEIDELEEVLDEYGINDIHTGNIGFIEDYPVFTDFSGYWG